MDHQEHDFGFVGISAAILDSITQRPCAGIGVSGRVELLGDPALRALAPEVMKAANEISALLNSLAGARCAPGPLLSPPPEVLSDAAWNAAKSQYRC